MAASILGLDGTRRVTPGESRLVGKRRFIAVGDTVRTPSGREAEVVGHRDGRHILRYLDESARHGPAVQPHLLTLLKKAGEP